VTRHALLIAASVGSLLAGACRDLDVVTASYATLAEAEAEGAVERGWVPPGLPPGTHELREAHDLDSNRRWGLFSFPPEESGALRALLSPDETPLADVSCDIPRRIEWWPVLLRGTLDADRIRTTGLRAHRDRKGELLFLVNWDQGRAYYWAVE
jgi:hypothetical protein